MYPNFRPFESDDQSFKILTIGNLFWDKPIYSPVNGNFWIELIIQSQNDHLQEDEKKCCWDTHGLATHFSQRGCAPNFIARQ